MTVRFIPTDAVRPQRSTNRSETARACPQCVVEYSVCGVVQSTHYAECVVHGVQYAVCVVARSKVFKLHSAHCAGYVVQLVMCEAPGVQCSLPPLVPNIQGHRAGGSSKVLYDISGCRLELPLLSSRRQQQTAASKHTPKVKGGGRTWWIGLCLSFGHKSVMVATIQNHSGIQHSTAGINAAEQRHTLCKLSSKASELW